MKCVLWLEVTLSRITIRHASLQVPALNSCLGFSQWWTVTWNYTLTKPSFALCCFHPVRVFYCSNKNKNESRTHQYPRISDSSVSYTSTGLTKTWVWCLGVRVSEWRSRPWPASTHCGQVRMLPQLLCFQEKERLLNDTPGDLNRSGPYRLMCLNPWSTGDAYIRRCGLVGGHALLGAGLWCLTSLSQFSACSLWQV